MSTLTDLNNRLFEQLDRISGDLTKEQLEFEMNRSKIVMGVSKEIIDGKRLMLELTKHHDTCESHPRTLPESIRADLMISKNGKE